jgi:hypothetical protein
MLAPDSCSVKRRECKDFTVFSSVKIGMCAGRWHLAAARFGLSFCAAQPSCSPNEVETIFYWRQLLGESSQLVNKIVAFVPRAGLSQAVYLLLLNVQILISIIFCTLGFSDSVCPLLCFFLVAVVTILSGWWRALGSE